MCELKKNLPYLKFCCIFSVMMITVLVSILMTANLNSELFLHTQVAFKTNFCSHMLFVGIYFLPCSTMRVNNNSRHLFSRQVSVCCYNVNGLFNRVDGSRICKLDNPEFTMVLKNDIIILAETHACKNDILYLDGYTCISNSIRNA